MKSLFGIKMENLIFIGLVVVVVAFGFWKLIGSTKWQPVDGTIIELSQETKHNMRGDAFRNTQSALEYIVDIKYEYTVEGRKMTGDKIYPIFPNIFTSKRDFDQFMSEYSLGKRVTVYVDPDNPSNASLRVIKSIPTVGIIIIVVVFILIVSIILFGIRFINQS